MSDVDLNVGQRMRARRKALGLSQAGLGARVGLAHQQIQRYETGKNRVPAPHLWSIAKELRVRVDFFFEGLAPEEQPGKIISDEKTDGSTTESKQVLHLVRHFRGLEKAKKRAVLGLVASLSDEN